MDALSRYAWPGNVRELCNALRTMIALCNNRCITVADLPDEVRLRNSATVPADAQSDAAK